MTPKPTHEYQGVLLPVGADVPSVLGDGWEYNGSVIRTPAADERRDDWQEPGTPFQLVCYRRAFPQAVENL